MHEAAAEALGLPHHYQPIEVAGADVTSLRGLLDGVRRLGFAGVNITFPYKEAVVEVLDELAPNAAAMQAVNTVVVRNSRLIGHNTDNTAFACAAADLVAASGRGPVAVIGAGGVGKAIAFALTSLEVSDIRIYDSDLTKARPAGQPQGRRRRRECRGRAEGRGRPCQRHAGRMLPSRAMPLAETLLRPEVWVADAVYSPLYTPLLLAAKANGARIIRERDDNPS